VLATLLGAAVRLFRLGHQSLWIDEQFTLAAAGLPGPIAWRDLLDNVHGPLYTLAVALAATLGGTSEWVLRLPSALAGIATVPAIAYLARRWTGRQSAMAAAWIAAGSPFLAWYSQEARGYAFVMLFAVLATDALLALRERVSALAVFRYLACAAAGALSSFVFALLVPLHLWLWLSPGRTRAARLRALAICAVLLALAVLPWVHAAGSIWDWSRLAPGRAAPAGAIPLRGAASFHAAAIPFALEAFAMGYSGGPGLRELRASPGAAVRAHAVELAVEGTVFGLLGLLGGIALLRRRRFLEGLLWLVAPALVVSYFAARDFKVFHPRYLAVSLPCVLLVLAAAFADLRGWARRGWAAVVAALWALALGRAWFEPQYGKEDYRGAMAFVRSQVAPGELVVATGAPDPVEWYGRGLAVRRFWLGHVHSAAALERNWADSLAAWAGNPSAGPVRGVWVVASRTEDLDPTGRMGAFLDARGQRLGRFEGVRLWHAPVR